MYVDEAINSILKARTVSAFDVVVIDTSVCEKASHRLQKAVPSNIKIIRKRAILTEVISFIYQKYINLYDFILRLDADDILMVDGIKKLQKVLEANPKIGAAYGGWQLINERSIHISDIDAPSVGSLQGFHGACTMFRTSALYGLDFDSMGITSQDGFATYMHLLNNNWEISPHSDAIFKYRRHSGNLSLNNTRLWKSKLNILRHYIPNGNLDAIIFIDSHPNELGKSDQKFIRNGTEYYYIAKGNFKNNDHDEVISPGLSLTEYICEKFHQTGKDVVTINLQKMSDTYFDGLIEYIYRIGMLSQARHTRFAQFCDMPIWHFGDNEVNCINSNDNQRIIESKSYFMQVRGINYFNFSKDAKRSDFIATNNFFTSSVEFYE